MPAWRDKQGGEEDVAAENRPWEILRVQFCVVPVGRHRQKDEEGLAVEKRPWNFSSVRLGDVGRREGAGEEDLAVDDRLWDFVRGQFREACGGRSSRRGGIRLAASRQSQEGTWI